MEGIREVKGGQVVRTVTGGLGSHPEGWGRARRTRDRRAVGLPGGRACREKGTNVSEPDNSQLGDSWRSFAIVSQLWMHIRITQSLSNMLLLGPHHTAD